MEINVINGELEIAIGEKLVASEVRDKIDKIQDLLYGKEDYQRVIVDMEKVQYIDSIGITFLIGIHKLLYKENKKLEVINLSSEIKNLFSMMKLEQIFQY